MIPDNLKPIFSNYMTDTEVMRKELNDNDTCTLLDDQDNGGLLAYYGKHPYPMKGIQISDAVYACNISKRAVMLMLNPLMLIGWRKNKERFERLAWYSLSRFEIPNEKWRTPVCRELCKLPIGDSAKVFAYIMEFDTAYRYRFQDIMGEVNIKQLHKSPYKEVKRLVNILLEREQDTENLRKKFARVKPFLWLLIPFKKKFLSLIKDIDFNAMKLDEADHYWAVDGTKTYNFKGIPYNKDTFITFDPYIPDEKVV